ncbi:MAG: rod shape-determining protein RodA [Firmicutes bacterium]|nr:rod shape-determining protein RodA [Bacillota bacterium]
MKIPRRYWRNLDWPLILAVAVLTAIGMVVIYSASYSQLTAAGNSPFYYVRRQALALVLGIAIAVLIVSIDYRAWKRWTRLIYFLSLLLLGGVLTLGKTIFGSQRWFRVGPFNIQPSELAKLALILLLARFLEKRRGAKGWPLIGQALLLTLVPAGLILIQPDMGTAIIFVGLFFAILYIAGAHPKKLALTGLGLTAASAGAILVSIKGWIPIIKPYQLTRLLVFLNPYADRDGAGWNIIQSMIAIGSGGFLGKGILNGTQSSLHFLPANHTDFVFSVIAEEFGFLGAMTVLTLFLFIIWRGFRIAYLAKDIYGTLLAAGATSIFFFHLVINVGMTLGIMPITGLPLPFITAGGSTMVTSLMAVAIILNVGLRRSKIMF